jgi:threonine dehydrogenase-like Zn-dependent dehydrogenase
MIGLWLEDRQLTLRDDLPRPEPKDGEALVRVRQAGICSTDHGLVDGLYPFRGVLGHEFVGTVENGPDDLLGRRVVGEINAVCGRCSMCRRGLRTHCLERTVLGITGRDGAFAEYLTLPAENLWVVPEGVSDTVAVLTEPLAAALQIGEQIRIGPSDRVLVVGDGKLGQLVAQTLALSACDLVVHGHHVHKLEKLARRWIRTVSSPDDIEAGSFDVAIECTGDESGFEVARKALRSRGTLVLKSTYPGAARIDATMLVVDEITLVGSRCGPFGAALRLLQDRRVDISYMVEGTHALRDGLAAFERSRDRDVLKVTLTMVNGERDE